MSSCCWELKIHFQETQVVGKTVVSDILFSAWVVKEISLHVSNSFSHWLHEKRSAHPCDVLPFFTFRLRDTIFQISSKHWLTSKNVRTLTMAHLSQKQKMFLKEFEAWFLLWDPPGDKQTATVGVFRLLWAVVLHSSLEHPGPRMPECR